MDQADGAILEVHDLRCCFPIMRGLFSQARGFVRAVDGVSLAVLRGKTLGLVGESGCGKTTLGRAILRLLPAGTTSGRVVFDGVDLFELDAKSLRATRRHLQIIFQDPVGSLNPRMTVGAIVAEPLAVHKIARGQALRDRVGQLLTRVGLSPDHVNRYPHEFSGGQRQRVGIARALALSPKLIICDEPVSALDVSIQAQILNLLADLQEEYGLSYLFIAHNLAVVKHLSHDLAVMYLGRIVEHAPADLVYAAPAHPYTQALMSAVPEPDPARRRSRIVLTGEVPSPINPPGGCSFHPRCSLADDTCRRVEPLLQTYSDLPESHLVACHHVKTALSTSTRIIHR